MPHLRMLRFPTNRVAPLQVFCKSQFCWQTICNLLSFYRCYISSSVKNSFIFSHKHAPVKEEQSRATAIKLNSCAQQFCQAASPQVNGKCRGTKSSVAGRKHTTGVLILLFRRRSSTFVIFF